MPRTVHRLTKSQRAEVRRYLRTFHREWVSGHFNQEQVAGILTQRLGFTVTRAHVGRNSRALRLRWPFNPRPSRGPKRPPREMDLLDVSLAAHRQTAAVATKPGKRLTNEALESLRHMADHLLAYAAEIEFIINNGRPSTSE